MPAGGVEATDDLLVVQDARQVAAVSIRDLRCGVAFDRTREGHWRRTWVLHPKNRREMIDGQMATIGSKPLFHIPLTRWRPLP